MSLRSRILCLSLLLVFSGVAKGAAAEQLAWLRLQIDGENKVELLEKRLVPGEWKQPRAAVGPRIYYELQSVDGEVLARGIRKDPRHQIMGFYDTATFSLTLPHKAEAASVAIYYVSYEADGAASYEHTYRLIGEFPVL